MKIRTAIAAAAVALASITLASPAHAWYKVIWYNANGSYAGSALYCDNGDLMHWEGTSTPHVEYEYHFGEPPC